MLGSHNSFTYLEANNRLYAQFPIVWRCQYKTIQLQYKDGARFFDVRVKLEKKANKNMWRVAHGIVDLPQLFTSIKNIFNYFKTLPGSKFRLILEDPAGLKEFKEEVKPYIDSTEHDCLFIAEKESWEVLMNRMPKLEDYCYMPFVSHKSTWENLRDMELCTIKKHADHNNPPISKSMIDDPNVIYFMDYI